MNIQCLAHFVLFARHIFAGISCVHLSDHVCL